MSVACACRSSRAETLRAVIHDLETNDATNATFIVDAKHQPSQGLTTSASRRILSIGEIGGNIALSGSVSKNFLRAFVVVSLAACRSDATARESPPVGDAFAASAVSVCQAALAQKEAWRPFPFPEFNPTQPDRSKFPDVAAFLKEETAVTFEAWLAGLKAIGEPPGGREAWDDVLTAVETIVQLNAAQVTAAETDDPDVFVNATVELGQAQVELVRATEAAGVAECADVHKE